MSPSGLLVGEAEDRIAGAAALTSFAIGTLFRDIRVSERHTRFWIAGAVRGGTRWYAGAAAGGCRGATMVDFADSGTPLSQGGFDKAVALVDAPAAALWAVLAVETVGSGYLPDRRPKILFERHIFRRLTGGRFDADDADVSAPTPGGYGAGGAHQYVRLEAALQFDREAALQSASWGLGQIMGENYLVAGYKSVGDMVRGFVGSEDEQLLGMTRFVASHGLDKALQAQNWAGFARVYNGPNYAANRYDQLLGHFYDRYTHGALPDLSVRAAQTYLNYRGFNLGVDGLIGPATMAAVTRYRHDSGLPAGGVDADLIAKLAAQSPTPA